ncbi:uncharacterized protein F4807DRAFT_242166 [Annulohypoxylon truncatum]|uniref:uncharacterized protein n=1 Tax=Annulohypoxylon truncatum TaxID=327061 RepID=UPI0020088CE1|nr:uncharacterized protein F4807DRAFT_242166 [Annulohypoxylon truncatum]KAI1205999.1 hypothetical protein F4807DRAFT_242166 [Annulohypoxylon truncatum]
MNHNNPEIRESLVRLKKDANINLEWASTRFWEYLFRHAIFFEAKWVISSQQPPTKEANDTRRVDIVVERMDPESFETILFVEVKKFDATQYEIDQVEYQAYTAACAYSAVTGKPRVWTMTSIGTKLRIWIFHIFSEYLIPYMPMGNGLGAVDEYIDAIDDWELLVAALTYIKNNSTPPSALLSMASSPRPEHAVLPTNWHDNEVHQVDAYRHSHVNLERDGRLVSWSPDAQPGLAAGEHASSVDSAHDPVPSWLEDTSSYERYDAEECTRIVWGQATLHDGNVIGHKVIYWNQDVWETIFDRDWKRAFVVVQGLPCLASVIMAASGRILYVLDADEDESPDA